MKQQTRIIIYIAIAITALILGVIAVLSIPKESTPQTADEFINAGNKYLLELSYDKAIIEFNKAIEIEPRNADAYIGLAEAYIGLGDNEKAIEVLERGYDFTEDNRILELLNQLMPPEETTVATTAATTTEATTVPTINITEITTEGKTVIEDNIEIIDVVCIDSDIYLFEVTVKYDLYSFPKGEINVGFSEKGKSGYHILTKYVVDCGTSEVTLNVTASSDYEINKCYANLSEYPHETSWNPLVSTSVVVTDVSNVITTVFETTVPETTAEVTTYSNILKSEIVETPKMKSEVTISGTVINNQYSETHKFVPTATGYYGIEYSCGEDTEKCSLSGSKNNFESGWERLIRNKGTIYLTKDEPYYFRFWRRSDAGYSYKLNIYTPNEIIDMNGKAKGTFLFNEQYENYLYIPLESGYYDFSISDNTNKNIKLLATIAEISNDGDLKVASGRISLKSYFYDIANERVKLKAGKKYQITIHCEGNGNDTENVEFEITISKLDL